MSAIFYRVIHLTGVILVFLSFGALIVRAGETGADTARRRAAATHGIGLLLIFISGFGMLSKLGLGFPPWAIVKIVIWLALGGMVVLLRKFPGKSNLWWLVVPLLGLLAAYLGVYKPG
jgi:hypothetical protein